MKLVYDRMVPRDGAAAGLPLPVEIRVDDDAFRHEWRAVALVESRIVARFELISENRRVPFQIPEMSARIRVKHQFVGIEAVSGGRFVGPAYTVAVNRAGMRVRDIAMPDLVGEFGQLDSRDLTLASVVEETKLDARRRCREECEIDPSAVPGGASRVSQSFPDPVLRNRDHRHSLQLGSPAPPNASRKQHLRRTRSERIPRRPWRAPRPRPSRCAEFSILS